ncbi:hypothetical protein ACJMK2_011568 [Sinanodonta woodiana]|uniref:Myb/SANT-like DNA-binding domain-containing protein n=1 Tax=Sinanodonta woodiana TaxID=1069815 RepID=A0ABD3V5F5_SINWO
MQKCGYDYNHQDCDKKMRAMKYRYRLISGSKTTPNKMHPRWEFYRLMDDLNQQSFQLTQTSAIPTESATSKIVANTSERDPNNSESVSNTVTEESSNQNQAEHEGGESTISVYWSNKAVQLLVERYRHYLPLFKSPFQKKLTLWKKVAKELEEQGYKFSFLECDKKMRALKYRYRLLFHSGKDHTRWEYFSLMEALLTDESAVQAVSQSETVQESTAANHCEPAQKSSVKVSSQSETVQESTAANQCEPAQKSSVKVSSQSETVQESTAANQCEPAQKSSVKVSSQSETVQESTAANQCEPAQKSSVKVSSQCETVQEVTTDLMEVSDESSDMDSMTEQQNEFSGDLPDVPSSAICLWSHDAVLLLIEMYRKYQELFHSRNYLKTDIWKKVADELQKQGYNYSYEECDKKMRNMKLQYKTHIEKKNKRVIGHQKWKYLELIADVAQRDYHLALPSAEEGSTSREEMASNDDLTEPQDQLQTKIWTHRAVLCLVEIYKDHRKLFTSRLHKKKTIWKKVAAELVKKGFKYNYISCDKKIRSLKHRYKMIIEGKDQTGKNNQNWKYFSLMDDLLAGDPVIWASGSLASLSKDCSVMDELSDENEIDILDDDKLQKQSSVKLPKNTASTLTTWTHKAILCLLKTYREHLVCFTSQGYKKADVYKKIASELQKQGFCYNRHQCNKKMRSLKYRYRLLLEGCDPSCRRRWRYYTLIDKLLAGDPTLKQKKGSFVHSKKSGTQTQPSQEQAGPPRKKLKKSTKPPAWFVAFAKEQRKMFTEIKELQQLSIQVAKERTELMKTFIDAVLHKT